MSNIITKKIDNLLAEIKDLKFTDLLNSKQKVEKALHLSLKIYDKNRILRSYLALASVLKEMNDYNNSLKNISLAFNQYQKKSHKDKKILFKIHLISSDLYSKLENLKRSIEELFAAIKIADNIDDPNFIGKHVNSIVRIFWEAGHFLIKIKNKDNITKIIDFPKKSKTSKKLFDILYSKNRTEFYRTLINNYKKYKTNIPQVPNQLINYSLNLILLHQAIREFDKALVYCENALLIAQENDFKLKINLLKMEKAKIYWKMKKNNKANEIIEQILKKPEVFKIKFYEEIYRLMYWIKLAQKDYQETYLYYKKYSEIRQLLIKRNNNNIIQNVKLQYEIQKYENKVRMAKKENELHVSQKELLKEILNQRTEKIMDMEKFYEVGKFAASIIHNLKNPLTSLVGLNDILKKKAQQNPEFERYAKLIEIPVKQMKEMLESIMGSVRHKKHDKVKRINLNKVLKEVIQFKNFDEYFRTNISCVLNLYPKIPDLTGKEIMFRQIFDNLINNAVDAMKDSLTKRIEIKTEYDKDFIIIKFQDYGSGIKKEHLKKIFETQFTTKDKGEGTGLGLSITKMMIEKMKGKIEVKTQISEGTTFTLYIPY